MHCRMMTHAFFINQGKMLINKLSFFFHFLEDFANDMESLNPITRRMYATGLINEMFQITKQLDVIDKQIDTSLGPLDACFDLSIWDDQAIKIYDILNEKLFAEDSQKDSDINMLTDFFPLENKDYSFTSNDAERFKTGMRYLCSDANLSSREIVYALNKGITSIISLSQSIKKKKTQIKDYQWVAFWNDFLLRDDDLLIERASNDYDLWKEEHDWHDIQVLKDKRTQETLKLLKSGVFNEDVAPVKREIANSIITIPEEALEDDVDIPNNIKIECARFSKYVTMKEDILCLDYMKLGRYVYKHYSKIKYETWDYLIYYENILLRIHEDMAECNPKLKKYLKFYEDEELKALLNSGLAIIDSCKELLKKDVAQDFLTNYLTDAFYGEPKLEVQAKLNGQSKFTLICNMLGMLKTTLKVFKLETSSSEIARTLSAVVEKPKEESLKRYIDEGCSINQTKLSKWTTQYVMGKLGSKTERLFVGISQK